MTCETWRGTEQAGFPRGFVREEREATHAASDRVSSRCVSHLSIIYPPCIASLRALTATDNCVLRLSETQTPFSYSFHISHSHSTRTRLRRERNSRRPGAEPHERPGPGSWALNLLSGVGGDPADRGFCSPLTGACRPEKKWDLKGRNHCFPYNFEVCTIISC